MSPQNILHMGHRGMPDDTVSNWHEKHAMGCAWETKGCPGARVEIRQSGGEPTDWLCDLGKFRFLSAPVSSSEKNGENNNSTYLIKWGLNELIHGKGSSQCLAIIRNNWLFFEYQIIVVITVLKVKGRIRVLIPCKKNKPFKWQPIISYLGVILDKQSCRNTNVKGHIEVFYLFLPLYLQTKQEFTTDSLLSIWPLRE